MLHALDAGLSDLAESIPCPDLLNDFAPNTADGYLYLASSQGLYVVDLVEWVQGCAVQPVLLYPLPSRSGISVVGGEVSTVVCAQGSNELILGKGLSVTEQIPLPALQPILYTYAPAIASGFAFITQRSSDVVIVCTLRDRVAKQQNLGGACLFSTPSLAGIACLVEANGGKRIVEMTPTGATVLIPSVPIDTTWLLCGRSRGVYLWGNGSSVTVLTNRGPRQKKESGNIGVPIVAGGRAIFISQDSVSSQVLSIDLSTGLDGSAAHIGKFGYTEVACAGSRLIVGNGRQIKSIAAEPRC
jgi:hypothetical protein